MEKPRPQKRIWSTWFLKKNLEQFLGLREKKKGYLQTVGSRAPFIQTLWMLRPLILYGGGRSASMSTNAGDQLKFEEVLQRSWMGAPHLWRLSSADPWGGRRGSRDIWTALGSPKAKSHQPDEAWGIPPSERVWEDCGTVRMGFVLSAVFSKMGEQLHSSPKRWGSRWGPPCLWGHHLVNQACKVEAADLLLLVKDQDFFFPFAVFITPTLLSHLASLPEPSALAN